MAYLGKIHTLFPQPINTSFAFPMPKPTPKLTSLLFKPENSKLRCPACNHKCLIAGGKRGLCGVRENQNGKLVLLVHSQIAAEHVDPIEKKPLYHFLPGTEVLSIGTVGCNSC